MTKTPFEIRFDLINFAQSQLTGDYYATLERIRDSTLENSIERKEAIDSLKYPTKDDIIKLATELKEFVDSK
jgi:hypothetical protein